VRPDKEGGLWRHLGDMPISDEAIGPSAPPDPGDVHRLLLDGAAEYAVFALSPTGIVSTWNLGAERIKGWREDQIVGRHFSVFYLPADRQAGLPEQELGRAVQDGRVQAEGWRVRQDGSRFWANVIITPLWDAAGRLRGFGKLTRDETERQAAAVLNQQILLMTEQERVGAALVGTVIRQLFAIGLHLDGTIELAQDPEVCQRVRTAVSDIDAAVRDIRQTVFDLSVTRQAGLTGTQIRIAQNGKL